MMNRRSLLLSAVAPALVPLPIKAQTSGRSARIGWVTPQREASLTPFIAAMRAGLADHGYVEGRNLASISLWHKAALWW
jgi:putative ABC transport system substrate-binding protein